MHRTPEWLHAVAAAHGAQEHARTERGVTVRRVTGGANNALYRVEADGHQYACKLCVADERQRARHEYGALRLLQAVGLDLAPRPLGLDESCAVVPYPVVVYRWLPGAPLSSALTTPQLAALIESIKHLHGIRPGGGRTASCPMPGSTGLTSRAISTKSTACWPRTELGWQLPIRRGKSYGIGSLDWCRTARILSRTQERTRGVSVCRSACAVWIQAWRTPCGATTAVCAGWIGNTAAGEIQPSTWRTCAGTRRSTNSALRGMPGCATATAGPRETMASMPGSGCGTGSWPHAGPCGPCTGSGASITGRTASVSRSL